MLLKVSSDNVLFAEIDRYEQYSVKMMMLGRLNDTDVMYQYINYDINLT